MSKIRLALETCLNWFHSLVQYLEESHGFQRLCWTPTARAILGSACSEGEVFDAVNIAEVWMRQSHGRTTTLSRLCHQYLRALIA